jgi:hypothetical protein
MYDQIPSTYLTGVNKMNVDKIENLLTNQKSTQSYSWKVPILENFSLLSCTN